MKIDLRVEGMHCGGCVRRVSALVGKAAGVRDVTVELDPGTPNTGRVGAEVDDGAAADALRGALEKAGYTVIGA